MPRNTKAPAARKPRRLLNVKSKEFMIYVPLAMVPRMERAVKGLGLMSRSALCRLAIGEFLDRNGYGTPNGRTAKATRSR